MRLRNLTCQAQLGACTGCLPRGKELARRCFVRGGARPRNCDWSHGRQRLKSRMAKWQTWRPMYIYNVEIAVALPRVISRLERDCKKVCPAKSFPLRLRIEPHIISLITHHQGRYQLCHKHRRNFTKTSKKDVKTIPPIPHPALRPQNRHLLPRHHAHPSHIRFRRLIPQSPQHCVFWLPNPPGLWRGREPFPTGAGTGEGAPAWMPSCLRC